MEKQWLCFQLADEWYLHDTATVQEIIPYEDPNPIPGSPPETLGMLDIRGGVITIFSGRALTALAPAPCTGQNKIITFTCGENRFGVVVDEVSEILSIDSSRIEQAGYGRDNPLIQGTIEHDGRLMIIIDFTRLKQLHADN